jgi:ABC-type sulfate/molybdate transport systems ATPase subunit
MLAMGRALMTSPKLLLRNEPSLGLAPAPGRPDRRDRHRDQRPGHAVLLIEQNAVMGLRVADRAYVLEAGHVTAAGSTDELAAERRTLPRGRVTYVPTALPRLPVARELARLTRAEDIAEDVDGPRAGMSGATCP